MFCPKCATQNLEGASYCRVCGANISLVPQALTGQMVQPPAQPEELLDDSYHRRRRGRPLTIELAFKNIFMGVAFVIISIALSRSIGATWWFWMLIPAFSMMGTGVAQIIRFKEREKQMKGNFIAPAAFQPQPPVNAFPTRATGELVPPPPSVTEGTTRHLGAEAPTRHFEE